MIVLKPAEVEALAREVIDSRLPHLVQALSATAILDHSGHPALQVEALMASHGLADEYAEERVSARTELQRRLGEVGDERFAYVNFTSEAERAELAAMAAAR